jgi:predicted negative regulator of RcsB-dependent stress response
LPEIPAQNYNNRTHVARTRLIRVILALQEYEQGLEIIASVDQSSLGGFAAIYEELKGDLYVAMGRVGEARTAYRSKPAPCLIQERGSRSIASYVTVSTTQKSDKKTSQLLKLFRARS